MGQVAIAINGRRYEVTCDDGEEDRLRQLADGVDQRVRALAASVGQVGEVRLLLLTCLLMQDELIEPGGNSVPVSADRAGDDASPLAPSAVADPAVGDELARLAERIEAVAAQLKQP